MSKSPSPLTLDTYPAIIKSEFCSPEVLHRALLAIEENLENIQGDVRDLLWEEKLGRSTGCQIQLEHFTHLIGEWEMAAIRTQLELEIAEERSRPI